MNLEHLRASDGVGPAAPATVTSARSGGATTLQVSAVTNWPDNFIATYGVLNAETHTLDVETVRVFRGHLDGSNIVIEGFAPGFVDEGNSVGDKVYIKPTSQFADGLVDILQVAHNDDGSLNDAAVDNILGSGKVATNVRVKPRISSVADVATLAPNIDVANYYRVTAQTTALAVSNPTGTPNDGDGLLIEITGTAARAITWDTDYQANSQYGLSLPSTTVTTKTTFVTFVYNATTSKYVAVM